MSLTDDDKAWISAKLEEVETRMLRAFRNFAHPVEARLRVQRRARALSMKGWMRLRIASNFWRRAENASEPNS